MKSTKYNKTSTQKKKRKACDASEESLVLWVLSEGQYNDSIDLQPRDAEDFEEWMCNTPNALHRETTLMETLTKYTKPFGYAALAYHVAMKETVSVNKAVGVVELPQLHFTIDTSFWQVLKEDEAELARYDVIILPSLVHCLQRRHKTSLEDIRSALLSLGASHTSFVPTLHEYFNINNKWLLYKRLSAFFSQPGMELDPGSGNKPNCSLTCLPSLSGGTGKEITKWLDTQSQQEVFIVKPVYGSCGTGVERLKRGEVRRALKEENGQSVLVQPFLETLSLLEHRVFLVGGQPLYRVDTCSTDPGHIKWEPMREGMVNELMEKGTAKGTYQSVSLFNDWLSGMLNQAARKVYEGVCKGQGDNCASVQHLFVRVDMAVVKTDAAEKEAQQGAEWADFTRTPGEVIFVVNEVEVFGEAYLKLKSDGSYFKEKFQQLAEAVRRELFWTCAKHRGCLADRREVKGAR